MTKANPLMCCFCFLSYPRYCPLRWKVFPFVFFVHFFFFFLLRKPPTQPTSRRAHNVDEMLMYPLGVLPRGWTWTYRTTLLNHQVIYFSRFHLPSRSVQCSVAVNGLNHCCEAEQSTIWTAVCAHYTTLYWDEQKNRTVWASLLLLFYADNKVQFLKKVITIIVT